MGLAKFVVLLAATASALATGPCPLGTYYSAVDGQCYYSYNGTIPWAAALNFCNGVNGQLVVPNNAFENSMLSGILQDLGKLESWLGTYSNNQGKWYDMSGNQLNYFRWAPGQPYSTSSCASIGADGLWYSDSCDDKEEFVCKIFPNVTATSTTSRRTTSTTRAPTTSTTTTRKAQSTTPLPTTTTTRSSYNPDPTRCPGYYTMNSTTPCDYGWKFFLPTCSCYLMSTKTVSWFEAEQNCVSNYKAHLTSVHSEAEAVFVKSLTTDSQKLIHVGLQYNHGWQWSDGTDVSFTNFAQRVYRTDLDKNPCAFIFSDGYYYSTYMGNGPCTLRYYHSVCKKPLPLL